MLTLCTILMCFNILASFVDSQVGFTNGNTGWQSSSGGLINSLLSILTNPNQGTPYLHHQSYPQSHSHSHPQSHPQSQPYNYGFGSVSPNRYGCSNNYGSCQHHCHIVGGRPECHCDDGYTLNQDFVTCRDIDECTTSNFPVCDDICSNTPGSYVCACSGQGVLLADGRSCSYTIMAQPLQQAPPQSQPVSCNINNGGCEQRCRTRRGNIKCRCQKGYSLGNDQRSCFDIDECSTGRSGCPGSCTNTIGSFQCTGSLQVAASCNINNGGCDQKCKANKRGIVKCKCRRNYNLAADGRTCVLVGDLCAGNNGGCDHNCIVENGQRTCSCNQGYELIKGKKCRPIPGQIDPCVTVRCHHQCRNEFGKAVCFCNQNHELINGLCTPVNQAQPSSGDCNTHQATVAPGCGSTNKNPTFTRIVGGRESNPDDWPWMCGLMTKTSNRSFCGGVLINPMYMLTAAHCAIVYQPNEIRIRVGEFDYGSSNDNCPVDHDVQQIIPHEHYSRNTNENDIALIKLARPAIFNKYVQPICLPLPSHNPIGKAGYITGWGTTSFLGSASNVLREAAIPVWASSECKGSYADRIYPGMMCAGSRDGKRDSCQGDSGGPLMQFYGSRWHLSGIVSWGEECAIVNKPGVYTQVNRFLRWISEKVV